MRSTRRPGHDRTGDRTAITLHRIPSFAPSQGMGFHKCVRLGFFWSGEPKLRPVVPRNKRPLIFWNRALDSLQAELTGKETEPWEILYFKAYKSQLPVIEQALETATLMLGSDKSRGYCLEMICADFLAGVSLEAGNRDALLPCLTRLVIGLPKPQRKQLLEEVQVTL